jgi:hypothetical protein
MQNNNCCQQTNNNKKSFLKGLFLGIIPHTFCIAFIAFSVIGASTTTLFFKKLLMTPYLFQALIAASFLFATVSAVLYLKKSGALCAAGIKRKWKYLTSLYLTTILVNVFLFLVIFPAVANMKSASSKISQSNLASISLEVQIPCSGHAPLIIDELTQNGGAEIAKFKLPNVFEVKYNAQKTSPEKIISLEIFKTYKATIQ